MDRTDFEVLFRVDVKICSIVGSSRLSLTVAKSCVERIPMSLVFLIYGKSGNTLKCKNLMTKYAVAHRTKYRPTNESMASMISLMSCV